MSRVMANISSAECRRWELPAVDEGDQGVADTVPSEEDQAALKALRESAYQEGLASGQAAGLEQYRVEVQGQVDRLGRIIEFLAQPLRELDEGLVEQVSRLAMQIAKHIIRREMSLNPGQVVATVHRAIDCLPVASRHIRVCLHPDDVAVIRDAFSLGEGAKQWRLIENPMIERGGCRIETESAEIDATVERRLNAICAEMLGGAREEDADAANDRA